MDWSLILGMAAGLGIPGLGGLFILVRMENRVTTLEAGRTSDDEWRNRVDSKLDMISRDLNQIIGAQGRRE